MSIQEDTQTMPPRKRLLLISGYFPIETGGAEQQVYCLVKYLQPRMDTHYLSLWDQDIKSRDPGIAISTIPTRKRLKRILGRYYALDYSRVMNAIRQANPDIIYTRSATAHLGMAARYAMASKCLLIWHISSMRDVQRYTMTSFRTVPFDYLDKRITEYGIRHADYIIGQAKCQDDLLRQNYGRACDLIVGNWHPEPAQPCGKGRAVKVVWIANIKPLKKPEAFIDLAERLTTINDVEYIMIGRPGSAKYQRNLESRMRNVKRLTYLGERSIDEVNRILAESHILVNTSAYEGFPNTFIQAWFREVPVVSLHVDPDGILARERVGFHSGSLERLARDTKRLIENSDLRTRMGMRARAFACQNHSLTRNLSRIAEFFEDVSGAGAEGAQTRTAETWAIPRGY
jgi:glycosyltransferase involved in cell wall biosynthesis